MNSTRIFFVMCFALSLAACDVVMIDQPLGNNTHQLDAAEVNGVWTQIDDGQEPFFAHIKADGGLRMATLQWKDNHFSKETVDLTLASIDDVIYVSGTSPDEPISGYFFARVEQHDAMQWTLLPPNHDFFSAAIQMGELKGKVSKGRYMKVVRVAAQDVVAFLQKNPADKLWQYDKAIILRRVEALVTVKTR